MDDEEHEDIFKEIERAVDSSRGYATYWEWSPDKQQQEAGVVSALANFLDVTGGEVWKKISPLEDDPPDMLAITLTGRRIGIEVTELVNPTAAAQARHAKNTGAPMGKWVTCSPDCYQSEVESRSFMMVV